MKAIVKDETPDIIPKVCLAHAYKTPARSDARALEA